MVGALNAYSSLSKITGLSSYEGLLYMHFFEGQECMPLCLYNELNSGKEIFLLISASPAANCNVHFITIAVVVIRRMLLV